MARWEHVDLDAGEWFIPKANLKDNVANLTVYLSPFSLEQFKALRAATGHTEWCFPNRGAAGHLDVKSISKQLGDRQVMFKKAKDGGARVLKGRRNDNTLVLAGGANGTWTPHDLRRTGATMMQQLGISLDIIDRCQNHVLQGSKVRRHYIHHDYAEEKRSAWTALGKRLSEIAMKWIKLDRYLEISGDTMDAVQARRKKRQMVRWTRMQVCRWSPVGQPASGGTMD
nr:tyrosine-type recombinase/integrase [Duganella guangzhouensis]